MIFGTAFINEETGCLETNNDSYPLLVNTTYSVSRPFLATGIVISASLAGFCFAFGDLIYLHEFGIIGVFALIGLLVGRNLAQLVLINRDLRGSDQSVALWGTYAHLNRIRKKAAATARKHRVGELS